MIYKFGNRSVLSIEIDVIKNDHLPRGILWGGFEIWVDNTRFGDIEIYDYIGGNYLDMVEKFETRNIPFWSFEHPAAIPEIYKTIYDKFTGKDLDISSLTLKEAAEYDCFWEKFVLSPNGEMEFDGCYIFYFLNEEGNATILYTDPNTKILRHIDIDALYLDNLANEFKRLVNQFLA